MLNFSWFPVDVSEPRSPRRLTNLKTTSKASDSTSVSASSNENSNSSLAVPERKNSTTDKPGPSR